MRLCTPKRTLTIEINLQLDKIHFVLDNVHQKEVV